MEAVTILGGGGHGADIRHDLRAEGTRVAGFFDDHTDRSQLGTTADWLADERPWLVGVNDPDQRWQLSGGRVGAHNAGIWIHRHASVGPTVLVGEHTHINAGVTITRSTLGVCCTVSPGVNICGDVTIGDRVLIGAGATISQFARIGDDVTIGAGAVITPWQRLIGGTWVGTPARCVS